LVNESYANNGEALPFANVSVLGSENIRISVSSKLSAPILTETKGGVTSTGGEEGLSLLQLIKIENAKIIK